MLAAYDAGVPDPNLMLAGLRNCGLVFDAADIVFNVMATTNLRQRYAQTAADQPELDVVMNLFP